MISSGFHLGLDYGTTHTVALLRRPDGTVRPLLIDGSPLLPSGVLAGADGHLLAGRDAERAARTAPDRFEPNPKRLISAGEALLGERAVPVTDLIAASLRRVVEEARRTIGGEPATVALTYPATWGTGRRAILVEAARRAGIVSPLLVAEPTAAAAYFTGVLGHRLPAGASMVVYDLGAGTFDVSVVRRTAHGFEVAAVGGLPDFGGLDLDALVVAAVRAVVPAEIRARLDNPAGGTAERRAFRQWWDEARAAKETLSREASAEVYVPLLDRSVHVTRAEFEAAAAPLLERTAEMTASVLARSGVAAGDLAGVLLVGGGSRIPLVASLLHRRLGTAPTVLEQPETVVAEGAAHLTAPGGPQGWAGGAQGWAVPGQPVGPGSAPAAGPGAGLAASAGTLQAMGPGSLQAAGPGSAPAASPGSAPAGPRSVLAAGRGSVRGPGSETAPASGPGEGPVGGAAPGAVAAPGLGGVGGPWTVATGGPGGAAPPRPGEAPAVPSRGAGKGFALPAGWRNAVAVTAVGLMTAAAVTAGFTLWPQDSDGQGGDGQRTGGATPPVTVTDSPAARADPLQMRQAAFGNGDLARFATGVVGAATRCAGREEVAQGQAPYAETGLAVPADTGDVVRCEGPGWVAYLWAGGPALVPLRTQRHARTEGNGDFVDGLQATQFVEWLAPGARKAIYFEPYDEFEGECAADLIATGGQDQAALRALFVELMG